jgi:hypothetical protein
MATSLGYQPARPDDRPAGAGIRGCSDCRRAGAWAPTDPGGQPGARAGSVLRPGAGPLS